MEKQPKLIKILQGIGQSVAFFKLNFSRLLKELPKNSICLYKETPMLYWNFIRRFRNML